MQNDVINRIKECEELAAQKYTKAQFDAAMIVDRARAEAEERYSAAEESARKKSYDAASKANAEAKADVAAASEKGRDEVGRISAAASANKEKAVALVLERILAK